MRTPTKFKVYVTLLWIGVVVGDDCVVVVLVAATLITVAEVDDVLRLVKAYGLTECEGDKIPMVRWKCENTPFTKNVDKKSVNDSGPTVGSQHDVTIKVTV